MAFSSSSLHVIARTPVRRICHYQTTDAIEDMLAPQYFNPARGALGIGDFVICEAAGPLAAVVYVTALVPDVVLARLPSESSEAIEDLQARVEALEAAITGDDEKEEP